MPSRLHITSIVAATAATWAAILCLRGEQISASWFYPLNAVAFLVFLVVALFDNWIWRWPFLHGWFVRRPDVRGTWKLNLESDWTDPKTGQPAQSVEGYVSIRQTYSTLAVRVMTRESPYTAPH